MCRAGNVRITLDGNIRTGLLSTDCLNDNLPTVASGDEIVFIEVKYDAFIPSYITGLLQLQNRTALPVSNTRYAVSTADKKEIL
ncbi:MAG: hypothetical protein LBU32_17180 [Clostridiales bacterium]|nr:hypothetical protein [Clostridiales bacterium]